MPKILVADDSEFMRSILKNILTGAGFTDVEEVGNGKEAIEKFHAGKADLVLMDIIMPEMDGIEALRTLAGEGAKVVMVTAVGQEEMVSRAMQLGARDFIVKPFNDKKVLETVKKHLAL